MVWGTTHVKFRALFASLLLVLATIGDATYTGAAASKVSKHAFRQWVFCYTQRAKLDGTDSAVFYSQVFPVTAPNAQVLADRVYQAITAWLVSQSHDTGGFKGVDPGFSGRCDDHDDSQKSELDMTRKIHEGNPKDFDTQWSWKPGQTD